MLEIGDIVKSRPNKIRSSGLSRGVVIERIDRNTYDEEPVWFTVYWFRSQLINTGCDVVLCEGLKDKVVCTNCEHRDSCLHLQEIARCDNSEFGHFRGDGNKVDTHICEQRGCEHYSMCITNKWIPEPL